MFCVNVAVERLRLSVSAKRGGVCVRVVLLLVLITGLLVFRHLPDQVFLPDSSAADFLLTQRVLAQTTHTDRFG